MTKTVRLPVYSVFGLLLASCIDGAPVDPAETEVATFQSPLTLPTNGVTGTNNGFYFSFWKDSPGTVNYTLEANGRYTANWSGINNWVGGKS
ncbi:MAG: glycoside hydrolase family 11 protein, partial [Myxococcales bacterium]